MDVGKYNRKWSIIYNGKPYLQIYGKKNAYDLLYRLSKYYNGLSVGPSQDEMDSGSRKRKVLQELKSNIQ